MKNMEVVIKFCKEVSLEGIGNILEGIDSHTLCIHRNSLNEIIWTANSEVEDVKDGIPIFEKLSNFAGIKEFSIEFREIPINFSEIILPYLPQILARIGLANL